MILDPHQRLEKVQSVPKDRESQSWSFSEGRLINMHKTFLQL